MLYQTIELCIQLVTFPGSILHEVSHRFVCDLLDVPVLEVKYFKFFSETSGHVVCKKSENFLQSFLIGIAPLIINSICCILLTFPNATILYWETDFAEPTFSFYQTSSCILYWAGLSMGFHAIPSRGDLENTYDFIDSRWKLILVILIKFLIFLSNPGIIGLVFRMCYAYTLSIIIPYLISY